MMAKQKIINVKGTEIVFFTHEVEDYISLTDIAKYRDAENPAQIISLWLRTYSTIEYLGLWETLHNPNFKPHIYEGFKNESARPHFWMSPQKWIKETNAIGITSKSGRYGGGTFAHSDIAFKFAAWISAEFELYLITEFKRLKSDEQRRLSAEWNLQRTLAKINYRIHTDAITENPEAKGNIRDEATLVQLVVLSNMESINALLIRDGLSQKERLLRLNAVAITQLKSLCQNKRQKFNAARLISDRRT